MKKPVRMTRSKRIAVAAEAARDLTGILLLTFVLLVGLSVRPTFGAGGAALWTYQPAVAAKQEARASAVDSEGNLILAGYSETVSSDYYTVKVLADGGGLAWPAKVFDKAAAQDLATAVAVDGNDDIIVTGYVHNGSNYDIHTIKYRGSDGAVLWQHTYDGAAGGNDFANAIAVDSLNNIYVGGTMQGANAKDDFVIIKYVPGGPNPDGTPTWVATYAGAAGNHDRLTAIAAGPDGIAVTGESQNASDFDFVTVKYGFDGAQLWQARYSDPGDGKGMAVALDASGNVIVTGYVHNGGNRDGCTIKYPAAGGDATWSKVRDRGYDDEGRTLWLDAAGNVYAAGSSFTLTTNKDLCVVRYAADDGAEAWHIIHNTSNGNNDVAVAIQGDDAGDLFVTSITNDNVGGFDNIHTYKFGRTTGTLLWSAVHGTATRHDRPVGIGLAPDGHPLMAGWSDTDATGYDFVAVKYDAGALDAPTALFATVVSTSEIALAWTDNAANEENFVVERKSGTGDWTVVTATLAADTASYNDTGLTADTRYYYRVKAINTTDGSSPYSNEVNARTTVISYDPPDWLHTYAGTAGGDDEPAALAVGPDNHPVVTGFSFDTEGGYDYYTLKLNRADDAAETWSARYNDDDNEADFATAVAVDAANRVIVSGYASLYGGGAGNSNDVYTLGYPAAGGAPTWADQYNGPAGDDDRSAAVASAVDGSNNVAVVGYGKNASLNEDIYLLKYNAAGARQWVATPYDGGGIDQPAAVAFAANDDIFVAGKTWRNGAFDYFVARYNGATGALLWGGAPRFYNGAGNAEDYATSLAVDGSGNLYVTGYSVGADGHGDIVTLRYNGATGDVMTGWPKVYDGGGYDHGAAVVVDPHNDDAVVAGTTFVGPGNHDLVAVRYAADGGVVWTRDLDLAGSDESAIAMAIDRSGVVCLAGATGADMLAVMFDHQGLSVGAAIFAGAAGGVDYPAAVAFNAHGEAFVAGASLNAANNTDFAVFKITSTVMPAPYPLSATQLYTQAQLEWADNALNETGFRVERKVGACAAEGDWTPVDETAANAVGYLAEGLNPGSDYCFRVRSFNGSGENSRWSEVDVTTAAPVPPDGLTATVQSTTEVRLQWNDHTDSETGFSLQRCTGAGCDFTVHDSLPVDADATSYVDASACPGQIYRYRIDAYKTGQWVSDFSAATGDVATPTVQAPSALGTDLVAEAAIELKWTDNSADEGEFRIERCAGGGCEDFATLGTLPSPSGNVLRMRMDEASWPTTAGAVIDLSGAGKHGTAVNGATTTAAGKYAYAGVFDGTNDYVSTALTLNQTATGGGATLAAWIYPASTSANNHFVIGTDNGGNDWSLLRAAGTWWVANGSDAALVDTGVAVTANTWQHLVLTFNPASGVTLYKNGVSVWSNAAIAFDTGTAAVHLGRRGSLNQEFFDGRLDEVAVFTRPVTGAEAQTLYEHGLGRYVDRTVSPGTTYRYQARAAKDADCAWVSDPTALIERTATPPAPTGLTATVVDSGRIRLTWTDNTSTETGFRVERCQGSGCGDFAEVVTTAADAVSYFDAGLCADPENTSPYSYRVVAVKGTDWSSAPSDPATATIAALAVPAALSVVSVSEDRVSLSWTYASTDLTGFQLSRCDGDVAFCAADENFGAPVAIPVEPSGNLQMLHLDESVWSGVANEIVDASGNGKHGTAVGGAASSTDGKYIRGGVFDGTDDHLTTTLNVDQGGTAAVTFEAWVYPTVNSSSYKYVVSTDNGGSDWGLAMYGASWYVGNGTGVVNTSQSVTFNAWQHMVLSYEPGVGIKLYRNGALIWSNATISYDASDANVTFGRQGTSGSYFAGRLDELAVYGRALSATEISGRYNRQFSYTQAGLTSGSPYRYRLRAVKSGGCAWTSSAAQVDTATVAPPPPTALSVVANQTTRVDLTWTDNATSETGYRVEHCPGDGTACDENGEFFLLAELPADSKAYSDATVCGNTLHSYRVRAEKSDGPIWQSAWVSGSVTTPAAGSTPRFDAVGMSESEIGLAWDDGTFDETQFTVERCVGDGADCDEDGEFATTVVAKPGTVLGAQLHYRMNEITWNGTAGEVKDASTNARHGQALSGAVTSIEGKYYRAGVFDGTNDYLFTPLTLDQTATGPGATVEAWVYPTVNSNSYKYVFSTENGGSDWGLALYGANWYVANGSAVVDTGQTATFNTWQHVALTFAPGVGLKLYRNGVLVWSNATIDYDASTGSMTIGRVGNSSNYFFAGRLDELAVYNRPLSLSEIQQHHQHQIQIFEHTDTGLTPGAVYSYRLTASRTADCPWSTAILAQSTTLGPPAPSTFVAMPIHTTRIDLAWSDETGSETAFRVQRCQGAGCADFADLGAPLPANSTSYSDTGVCPGQVYRYQVRAEKSDGPVWTTPWFGPVEATALSPVDPTALGATRVAENQIDLAWSDSNPDETGFVVERCAGDGCGDFAPVANLPASEIGGNLITGANGAVGSFTSNVVELFHPRTGAAVKALQLTHSGSTPASQSATLNLLTNTAYLATFDAWSDAGDPIALQNDLFPDTLPEITQTVGPAAKSYRAIFTSAHADMGSAVLRFFHYAAGRTIYVTNITLTRLTYPVTYSDLDTGLAPDTLYTYRVKAVKATDCGWSSGYSASASALTSVDAPGALTAVAADTTTVNLSWTDNSSAETSTQIERCAGAGCGNFAQIASVGPNVTQYTDTSVANGGSYSYRVKALNQGLAMGGGGAWTRSKPVSFTAFGAYENYEMVVPYDADMRADFGDLRFYDETAKKQLPYWIKTKTDGVTATVWFSTRSNNTVNLYYGNPSATDAGVQTDIVDSYTFAGTAIDTNKWAEIDPSGGISQNNALLLNDVTEAWTMALISKTTYARSEGRELYFDLTIPVDTAGNNHFMAGWELNQTASAAYSQLVHGLYWNNYAFDVYQKNGSMAVAGRAYAASTRYQMKVVLKTTGAKYYVRGGAYADWTLIHENASYNDATLRIGIHQYSHQASIHRITVTPGSVRTGASLGAEQSSSGYEFVFTWTSAYSNVASVATPAKVAPSGLAASAVTDSQIDLAWSDNTGDETGFKIERCLGSGCGDFSQIATVAANVGSYSNTGLSPSTIYRYRVRAYKTATQSWDSDYSNTAEDLLFPRPSSGLTATALNSRMIRLEWEDNGSDEEGFEIEVKVWNGRFIQTAKVDANVTSYTDHIGIDAETTYVYRVRPYRGADQSPYSNEASVVTPEFSEGDNTCPP